jgi:hypothetical protein
MKRPALKDLSPLVATSLASLATFPATATGLARLGLPPIASSICRAWSACSPLGPVDRKPASAARASAALPALALDMPSANSAIPF